MSSISPTRHLGEKLGQEACAELVALVESMVTQAVRREVQAALGEQVRPALGEADLKALAGEEVRLALEKAGPKEALEERVRSAPREAELGVAVADGVKKEEDDDKRWIRRLERCWLLFLVCATAGNALLFFLVWLLGQAFKRRVLP